jgi:hypothetical protein
MYEPTSHTNSPAHPIPDGEATPVPPDAVAPPAKPPFWKSTAGSLVIVAAVLAVFAGAVTVGLLLKHQRHADLDVSVVSCDFHGSTAVVGYMITNKGGSAHDVTLHIEYRDASGARVDTDTSYARVPAHDTVRGSESTFLDAPADDGRCLVTY